MDEEIIRRMKNIIEKMDKDLEKRNNRLLNLLYRLSVKALKIFSCLYINNKIWKK